MRFALDQRREAPAQGRRQNQLLNEVIESEQTDCSAGNGE